MIDGKCEERSKCTTCLSANKEIKYLNEQWTEGLCSNCTCTGKSYMINRYKVYIEFCKSNKQNFIQSNSFIYFCQCI